MKAERRHELKENDLAHMLDQAGDYLREKGSRLGLIAAGIVVVVAVVGIAVRSRAVALEDAWQLKRSLSFETTADGKQSLQSLASLTAASTDPGFIMTGLLDQGRYALELAHKAEDPPDREMNEKAGEAYSALLQRFPRNPIAFGAAHVGLATVEENLFALDRDPAHEESARGHLQAILDRQDMAVMPFFSLATGRLENLDEVFTVTRFAAAPIVPEAAPEPALLGLPAGINAVPISADQVPENIRRQAEGGQNGSVNVEDDGQE